LYLAPYILLEKETARVNSVNNVHHSSISCLQTKWEYGGTGGYQHVFFKHLVLNPCAFVGYSKVTQAEIRLLEYRPNGIYQNELLVMIRLLVGWKF
jgi:hypothetical protein